MSALNQADTGAKISVTGQTEQDERILRKKKVLESFRIDKFETGLP